MTSLEAPANGRSRAFLLRGREVPDKLVYELYGLTEEEFEIVEESTR
jgi:hypothetical protein